MTKPYEFAELANYNAERSRGIVHTSEWDARMVVDQERFDAQQIAEAATAVHDAGHELHEERQMMDSELSQAKDSRGKTDADGNPVDLFGKPYYLGAVFGGDARKLDRWFLLGELQRFYRRGRRYR